jgi:hypothetical protein
VAAAAGDIAACSRERVCLWDVNGDLVAASASGAAGGGPAARPVGFLTCVAVQDTADSGALPLLATGLADGRVQVWMLAPLAPARGAAPPGNSSSNNNSDSGVPPASGCAGVRALATAAVLDAAAAADGAVTAVRWSSDRRRLMAGYASGRVLLWSLPPQLAGAAAAAAAAAPAPGACASCGARFAGAELRFGCALGCGAGALCGRCCPPAPGHLGSQRVCRACGTDDMSGFVVVE